MEKTIKRNCYPANLDPEWDNLADFYFQKKEFLIHLHQYNPCAQRYYELYCDDRLVAGTVVYTLKIDIFTFANIPSPFKVQVIGLPVSVATPPIIGETREFEYLLSEIIKNEHGLILGINFMEDYLRDKVLNLRTLPTVVFNLPVDNLLSYEGALRHNYRRRLHRIREKFSGVTSVVTPCAEFSEAHYELYLQIMKKTTTKLETLSFDVFRHLPSHFVLTTYYYEKIMLCWHVVCLDKDLLIFFFSGMDYKYRGQFQSYNNNLLGILAYAFDQRCRVIDFGQTAEIAKTRLGGELCERRMFFYHRNPFIFLLLKLSGSLINYSKINAKPNVFKLVN